MRNGKASPPMTSNMVTTMPTNFTRDTLPGRIVFRDGAINDVGDELAHLDARYVMLIATGRNSHLLQQAQRAVGARLHILWNKIRQHVPRELARIASATATEASADALVAVGGGSTIGLAKAVAVSTGLPLVCVPTTYSGSEMTPIYGLTSGKEKKTARDANALPKVVIYDPQLLASLPPDVVGPSGLNALAHCAEALWAPGTDPISDAMALDGARRINQHLRSAYSAPDIAERGEVMIGSCLAGAALGTVGTSIHHALCHLLGGMYDTPHAATHAIVLPYAVEFVRPNEPVAIQRLSAALGVAPKECSDTIWSLGRAVGTPRGLRAIGLTQAQAQHAAEAALAKGLTSPRNLTQAGLSRLLDAAWRGMSPSIT
jgi:maleylacetate reductase